MRIARGVLLVFIIAGMTIWAIGAIYYSPLLSARWRPLVAGSYAAITALALLMIPRRRLTAAVLAVICAILVVLFSRILASNDRDWQPEVAVMPWAEIDGTRVTIHGVRNLDYRTETDFTARWEDRAYDLGKLDSVDLVAAYWAGRAIAHLMLSFGFERKDYVAISIELRKERGERYSTLAGFFKQYELVYVVADERDVIGVRTTYRRPQEEVYIYRIRAPRENIRRAFLDYLKTINEMREQPRFYNTLTTNCTTGIWVHTKVNPESPPWSWKILLSGYIPERLYQLGRLDMTRPFAELERLSYVSARARAADKNSAFSQRIREGLPQPTQVP